MFIRPTGFDDLVAHCCRALHASYGRRNTAPDYDKAAPGIQAKTRQDVETILIAAAQRSTCLLLPGPVTA